MRQTSVPPGRECSTSQAEGLPIASALCQHPFADQNTPHYCTYIQVRGSEGMLHLYVSCAGQVLAIGTDEARAGDSGGRR